MESKVIVRKSNKEDPQIRHNFEVWAEVTNSDGAYAMLGVGHYILQESAEIARDACKRLLEQMGHNVKD